MAENFCVEWLNWLDWQAVKSGFSRIVRESSRFPSWTPRHRVVSLGQSGNGLISTGISRMVAPLRARRHWQSLSHGQPQDLTTWGLRRGPRYRWPVGHARAIGAKRRQHASEGHRRLSSVKARGRPLGVGQRNHSDNQEKPKNVSHWQRWELRRESSSLRIRCPAVLPRTSS